MWALAQPHAIRAAHSDQNNSSFFTNQISITMTNSKTILIILIAFTAGYVVRMLVHPKTELDLGNTDPIPSADAQKLVDNFTQNPKYYVVSQDVFNAMTLANLDKPTGKGFVIYFGASTQSDVSDVSIIATIADTTVKSQYYLAKTGPVIDHCPLICDIDGLKTNPVPVSEEPTDITDDEIDDEISEEEGLE